MILDLNLKSGIKNPRLHTGVFNHASSIINRTSKGFTLVEVLLYIAIVSFVVGVISTFFFLLLEVRVKNRAVAEVDQQGQYVMRALESISREATAITSPTAGSSSASITFTMPNAGEDPAALDINSGRIRLQEGANSYFLTSNELVASAISVENLTQTNGTGTARVIFTLASTSSTGRYEYEYSQTFITSITPRY